MYFIESLKSKYPTTINQITKYDLYLRNHHPIYYLEKIFNDQKENFKYVNNAYNALSNGNIKDYQLNMCLYEKSLNNDPDFLDMIKNTQL